jgi:hypothetical protein
MHTAALPLTDKAAAGRLVGDPPRFRAARAPDDWIRRFGVERTPFSARRDVAARLAPHATGLARRLKESLRFAHPAERSTDGRVGTTPPAVRPETKNRMNGDGDDETSGDLQDGAVAATDRGQRIQVALAEFNALRSELDTHVGTQEKLIALVVTAIGIVAGLVIREGGDPRLLLILPFLVSAAGIHYAEQTRGIALIGSYIRDALWPYVRIQLAEASTRSQPLPSWEDVVSDFRMEDRHRSGRVYRSYLLSSAVPGAMIFMLGSVVPLVVLHFVTTTNGDGRAEHVIGSNLLDWNVYRAIWWLGVILTVVYVAIALSARSLGKPLWDILKNYDRLRQWRDALEDPATRASG